MKPPFVAPSDAFKTNQEEDQPVARMTSNFREDAMGADVDMNSNSEFEVTNYQN